MDRKSESKSNLNESTLPLLDEDVNKEKIELEEKDQTDKAAESTEANADDAKGDDAADAAKKKKEEEKERKRQQKQLKSLLDNVYSKETSGLHSMAKPNVVCLGASSENNGSANQDQDTDTFSLSWLL